MIVRSIKVSGWRCFLEEVEVGPLDSGLNVIHAPNGTGKSRLFEALQRVLLDGHRVTGRDIEAIRPWGRQVAPRVTVEFSHGGQDYRIAKQFLDNPSAVLEQKEDGRYRRLAEGTAADERTRALLTSNPPGRGLARPENWGIAQVLWAPQGNLAIGPLTGDAVAGVRAMLSAQVVSADAGPIEDRIKQRYLEYFTATGRLRAGREAPLVTRLEEELADIVRARQRAYEAYIAFEEASRRVEELRNARLQARHSADEVMKLLRDARTVADEYRNLAAEKNRQSEQAAVAKAKYRELKQRIDLIKSTEKELGDAQEQLAALQSAVPFQENEVREREKEAAQRKAELEDARKARETVDAAGGLADAARRFHECRRELQRLDERVKQIEQTERALTESRRIRNAHAAPDAHTLRAIRKAAKDRDEARVRLEASLITLEIVPRQDGPVEVVAGAGARFHSDEGRGSDPLQGSPEVVAELPGIARLRASGPAGSVEEHREARAKAKQRLNELAGPFGTSGLDALESLAEKARELDAAVAEAETRLQTLLAGSTADELAQNRSLLETAHRGFLQAHPEWEAAVPDAEALERTAIDVKDTFVARVENAEAAWEMAQNALTAVAGRRDALSRQLDDAAKRVSALKTKRAELSGDGKTAPEREAELQRILMEWDAARARSEAINDKLKQYEDDPLEVVERLEKQLAAANDVSGRAREQEVREEARLEALCAEGPYSALAAADERLAQLEQEAKREQLRIEAIRLLHDTVAACRSEMIAAVSEPVQAAATRTLQRIAGRRLGRIEVGDAFEPAAVAPEASEQKVGLENLSGGEQEQLYLAARLALAEVLSRDERQLVVLDDVLTATDTGRLARVLGVLEEAAQRLQVLVLTCHPERYRGLKTGAFFDLEQLVRQALPR